MRRILTTGVAALAGLAALAASALPAGAAQPQGSQAPPPATPLGKPIVTAGTGRPNGGLLTSAQLAKIKSQVAGVYAESAGAERAKAGAPKGAFESNNWSGLVNVGFMSKVPKTAIATIYNERLQGCPDYDGTPDTIDAHWVGLDGWGNNYVEQDGLGEQCTSNSTYVYWAWYEMYPEETMMLSPLNLGIGDALWSYVAETNVPGVYNMELEDLNTGAKFLISQGGGTAAPVSSEIVSETPEGGVCDYAVNSPYCNMPDYGTEYFRQVQMGTVDASVNLWGLQTGDELSHVPSWGYSGGRYWANTQWMGFS